MNVEIVANDIGKNITPTINMKTKSGFILKMICSIDETFLSPKNVKQPLAISQNRDGIEKYAVG